MKHAILTSLLVFTLGLLCVPGWLPWWALAPLGTAAGWWMARNSVQGFLGGFLGGLALWLLFALLQDVNNGGILSTRIGALFAGLPREGVLAVTGLTGGLLGGMGALTGYCARAWRSPRRAR